jgi:hypothetical protein
MKDKSKWRRDTKEKHPDRIVRMFTHKDSDDQMRLYVWTDPSDQYIILYEFAGE